MPFIQWDDRYLLGIGQFDEHHKYLFKLLNSTYDLFMDEENDTGLKGVLDELIDYATYHFAAEEAWMCKQNYPRLLEHKEQHADFACRVAEFQRKFVNERGALTLEVLSFLQRWMVEHIKKCDGQYVACIRPEPV